MKKTIILCSLISLPALAQEDLLTIDIEGAVPDRTEDKISTFKDFGKRSATDMRTLFQDTQSVTVGGGATNTQKLYVRGVEDVNLNIQVDGARQGNHVFHHQGNLFLDPENIKSIEVRPGTARADDGYGTIAGAVIMKTKNIFDYTNEDKTFGGTAKATYYSNQRYTRPSLTFFSKLSDNFGVVARGNFVEANEYTAGNGDVIKGTNEKLMSGQIKFSGRGDKFTYDVSAEHVEDQGLRPQRGNFGYNETNNGQGPEPLQKQTSKRTTYSANGVYVLDPKLANIEANVYHTLTTIERGNFGKSQGTGGSLSNTMEFQDHRVKLGTDQYYVKSMATRGEETAHNQGLFIQNQFKGINRLTVDYGTRLDFNSFNDVNGKEINHSGLSPNLRLEYCAIWNICGFAGYSETFRGVAPVETFLLNDNVQYPKKLRPEKGIAREVGLNWKRSYHRTQISFYKNDIIDFMYHVRGTPLKRINEGNLRTQGYEASYEFNNPRFFRFRASYTQVRPEFDGTTLDQTMGHGTILGNTLQLSLSKTIEKYGLTFGTNYRSVERVEGKNITKPSFNVTDLWATYDPRRLKDWSFGLYVSNIFNDTYIDHATFFASRTGANQYQPLYNPGRDIRVSATYRF
ncbi:MAG TPA: TonB-dependent receptor [Bacteriovoracaceae bacterium]|nr:TonB-dependent receptor [Bacteriovoracaceae bacterium]